MHPAVADIVVVEDYVWVLDPSEPMRHRVSPGGHVLITTAPGCWGPMITPDFPSTHEVSSPIYVEGAAPGDAVAIILHDVRQISRATTSGTHRVDSLHVAGDPGISPRCPNCGLVNPPTKRAGTGAKAIRCVACGAAVAPYQLANGYTMLFNDSRTVGVTVPKQVSDRIALEPELYTGLPPGSSQYSANVLATPRISNFAARIELMVGNIGTLPAVTVPSSRNAGDFALKLVGVSAGLALTEEDVVRLTDSHSDINEVRAGAVMLAPVRVPGAGVFVGDVHAMQGDGELAGHTTDVVAQVHLEVRLVKGLDLPGPVLLPRLEDLSRILRPFTEEEWNESKLLAHQNGFVLDGATLPIEIIGTGRNVNVATENAIERACRLTRWEWDDVRNRATIAGGVRIGRFPGVVQLGIKIPPQMAQEWGILELLVEHYGEHISHLVV